MSCLCCAYRLECIVCCARRLECRVCVARRLECRVFVERHYFEWHVMSVLGVCGVTVARLLFEIACLCCSSLFGMSCRRVIAWNVMSVLRAIARHVCDIACPNRMISVH